MANTNKSSNTLYINSYGDTYGILIHNFIKSMKSDLKNVIPKFNYIYINTEMAFNQRRMKSPIGLIRKAPPILSVNVSYDNDYDGGVLGSLSFESDMSDIIDVSQISDAIFQIEKKYTRDDNTEYTKLLKIGATYKRIKLNIEINVIENSRQKSMNTINVWNSIRHRDIVYTEDYQMEWTIPDNITDTIFDIYKYNDKSIKAKLNLLNVISTGRILYRESTSKGTSHFYYTYTAPVVITPGVIDNSSVSFDNISRKFITQRPFEVEFNVPNILYFTEDIYHIIMHKHALDSYKLEDDDRIATNISSTIKVKNINKYINNAKLYIDARYMFDDDENNVIDMSPMYDDELTKYKQYLLDNNLDLSEHIQYNIDSPDMDVNISDIVYDVINEQIIYTGEHNLSDVFNIEVYINMDKMKHISEMNIRNNDQIKKYTDEYDGTI